MENKPGKNISLVQTIINLHEQGYSEDFFISEKGELIWGQRSLPIQDFVLDLMELELRPKNDFKTLLYLITLDFGTKGILLCQNNDISEMKNRFPNAR